MNKAFALIAIAGIATAANAQESIAYWAQNNNLLNGGGFGFDFGDFPQGADFGLQSGSATLALGGGDILANDGVEYDWVQSFSGSTGNAQFGEGSGGAIAIQNGTGGVNNGAWMELRFDATDWKDVILSFDARRTGSGFDDVDIQAFDGATLLGDIAADFTASSSFATESFSTTLLDDVADARIRFTFNGGSTTSTTGNNRFDNLFIQATAIPAPGAAVLAGVAGLAATRRRRG